jgi:hypothetical protein
MTSPRNDRLLSAMRVFVAVLIVTGAVALLGGVAVLAVVLLNPSGLEDQLLRDYPGLDVARFRNGAAACAAITIVCAGLFIGLLRELRTMVDRAFLEDPFRADNDRRLARMGRLSLALAAISAPVPILSPPMMEFAGIGTGVTTSWLFFTLVLFVLARVFRHGAAMRDDLEGTV